MAVLITFTSGLGFAEKSRAKSKTSKTKVTSPKKTKTSVKTSAKSKSKASSKKKVTKKSRKKVVRKNPPKKAATRKAVTKKAAPKKAEEAVTLRKSQNRKSAYDNENLGEIYHKEREFFRSDYNAKNNSQPSKVKGPLASIPTAVVESMVGNLVQAHQDRTPKEAPPPPEPVAKTPDQLFNVEPTIQGAEPKKKVEAKSLGAPPPSAVVLASLSSPNVKTKKTAPVTRSENVRSEIANELNLVPSGNSKRIPSGESVNQAKLLETVEKKYTSYFVVMAAKFAVTQALLERTKSYSGKIYLAPGGRFKLEAELPNKHMIIMDGKNIWVVDYPLDDAQDKVQILHSKSAKSLKNQAFLSIFQGVGKLKRDYKIESSSGKNDEIIYKLTPKKKADQVDRVELKVDYQSELITSLTFWDSLGNQTQLQFTDQDFEPKVPSRVFQFRPPKNSSVTHL